MGYLSQLYVNLLMTHAQSDVYLFGMVFVGLLQVVVVCILYPFGIFNMVIGYISVHFLSILFWHHCIKKYLPIKLTSICKDIIPYLVICILTFLFVNFVLDKVTNLYLLLLGKICLSVILYIALLKLLGFKIFEECLEFIKSKMQC